MSGAEALFVVGIIANVVGLVDFSNEVLERFADLKQNAKDVPKAFQDLNGTLPTLKGTLLRTKTRLDDGSMPAAQCSDLRRVVTGCEAKLQDLKAIFEKVLPKEGASKRTMFWKALTGTRRDKDVTVIANAINGYVAALTLFYAELSAVQMPVQILDRSTGQFEKPTKTFFVVPFEKDEKFVDRAEIIYQIDQKSKKHRYLALAGIGGIGKSQIAIEYCYRFQMDRPDAHVIWIHASSTVKYQLAYAEVASTLKLPGWEDNAVDKIKLVNDWLDSDKSGLWLLVLDNVDDIEACAAVPNSAPSSSGSPKNSAHAIPLPRRHQGTVLITTRDRTIGQKVSTTGGCIWVPYMALAEASELFRSHCPAFDLAYTDDLNVLIEKLDYLPLAISQAAAFIEQNGSTLEEYLELLNGDESEVHQLLDEDLGDVRRPEDSENSVLRTWKLSLDLIKHRKPRAAELLSLMAMFDRQGIPKSLLRDDNETLLEFTTALGTLQAFSLVGVDKQGSTCQMHRLVQFATIRWLELHGSTMLWQGRALEAMSRSFPSTRYETWKTCELLLPHTLVVVQRVYEDESHLVRLVGVLANKATFDYEQGRYGLAEEGFEHACGLSEARIGPEHVVTLRLMSNLGLVYYDQGRLSEAEKLEVKILEMKKRVLGEAHPDTLLSINNLACFYQKQGRLGEAEKLEHVVLETRKRVLGEEHPDTLTSMNNLAATYYRQGRLVEAEKLEVVVLKTKKRVLGEEHPSTLLTMTNLAASFQSQERWNEAEELHMAALELRTRVLGEEHPDTLSSMGHLACTYCSQRRWNEAEKLEAAVLEVRKRVLGEEHPSTLSAINNLALTYWNQGRGDEAEQLMLVVVDARRRVLGQKHPDTLFSIEGLAIMSRSQDRRKEVEHPDEAKAIEREKSSTVVCNVLRVQNS